MSTSAPSVAGDRVRHYLRDVVLAEPGVGQPLAERLADRLNRNLDRVVELYKEQGSAKRAPKRAAAGSAPLFDPYAFSAVVTLERDGRDALLMRLETIESAEHLRQIAEAQHLSVDLTCKDPATLRLAIVAAAAERIADRRAASS